MAYCPKCGASVAENEQYCGNCGTRLTETAAFSDDVNDNRAISVLSYIGPLCFVPYFAAKRSPFAHYHALRGLNLFILEGVYAVLKLLIGMLLKGVFGTLVSILLWLGWGFFVYLSIMGIIHVCKGEKKDLPFIGKIRFIKN